ncbi:MAG: MmgE/PrpD family protein [Candidatus Tectomicrobia bacterium]|uniref:MmgE/PrpD family protein n=1 Tax=Tectimicrobiota bacterium TaxID=2528274 RepID=A0A932I0N4_UNCTE|nr:MmgE/PrpD family protein [Candidatus Tectomicrobia bacterium]
MPDDRPYPATAELARRIAQARVEDVDPPARAKAREAVVDTLGVALAGSREECARLARELAAREGGAPKAALWGGGGRTSLTWAAFANGTAGHALDFDDTDFILLGHPSVVLAPALIALAGERGRDGAHLLAAYAVGFETLRALGRALNPRHYRRGFHATATLGTVGAAAACAHLLRLGEERTRHALSLAASQAAGLGCNFGTMTKPFHAGQASRAGLLAALLAEAGFTSGPDALETGFTAALAAEGIGPGVERFADWEGALRSWGPPWDIEGGVSVKLHPCCAMTHTAIDAMLALRETEGIRPGEVESLGAKSSAMAQKILRYSTASNGLEGKFSMQFCLASALADGRVGLPQFEDQGVQRPLVQDLQRRASFGLDPALDPESHRAEVWVRLKDGREARRAETLPRGHAERPVPEGELRAKFLECAALALPPQKAQAAWDAWWEVEGAGDVGKLAEMLG